MLYIVPTPIGNLEDITLRALSVLQSVDMILAEDTRTSKFLLQHHGIDKTLHSFHSFNEHRKVESVVELLQQGKTIALISDAGTPGISDPGFLIVRACHQAGIKVSCLPGATALIPALVASGLPCDRFYFEGFLPHKKGRHTRLTFLAEVDQTIVLYESPFRLVKCLEELANYLSPQRQACVVREISKMHEEVKADTLENLIAYYKTDGKTKGEIVIVVGGKNKQNED